MVFTVTLANVKGITVVYCSGIFQDEAARKYFLEKTESVLSGTPQIVVHLGGVRKLDSQGIGALIALFNAARKLGGDMTLAALTDSTVCYTLEVTRVTALTKVFPDEHAAVESFLKANSAGIS